MPYSKSQKEIIFDEIRERLNRVLDSEDMLLEPEKHVSVWKNIVFLLDKVDEGNFFGTISFKVTGSRMWNGKVEDQTFRLDTTKSILDIEKKL